jgi:dTDP-4-dehydrorhamnose reductase
MLGQDLVAALRRDREIVVGLTRRELDITDHSAVVATVRRHKTDVLVNCAAWTAVDEAEKCEDEALRVNGTGVANLAAVCAAQGARLVHVSTDYVFGGDARRPYSEWEVPDPRTAYGRTKFAGEKAVLRLLPESGYVVRTAWLYGACGPNFVRTMMRLERQRPTVDVVDDQYGQPTWTVDLVGRITALIRANAPAGVYHATSSGETTWFGLASEVFRLLGADPSRVTATSSRAFQRAAARPAYSVLGHEAWGCVGLDAIGPWSRALRTAFPALTAAEGISVPVDNAAARTGQAEESR